MKSPVARFVVGPEWRLRGVVVVGAGLVGVVVVVVVGPGAVEVVVGVEPGGASGSASGSAAADSAVEAAGASAGTTSGPSAATLTDAPPVTIAALRLGATRGPNWPASAAIAAAAGAVAAAITNSPARPASSRSAPARQHRSEGMFVTLSTSQARS